MEKTIISEGKTSTEAINNGLKELHCRKDDVNIKILESEDKRSFFNILEPRIVKVELTLKNSDNINYKKEIKKIDDVDLDKAQKNIEGFLEELCRDVGKCDYAIVKTKVRLNVEITGENSELLIGYRGETLNGMEFLLSTLANKDTASRVPIALNISGYKQKREETLKKLAKKMEREVKESGKKQILEPMTPFERKIIHSELQDSKYVTTYSIGEEPRRKVVIDLK